VTSKGARGLLTVPPNFEPPRITIAGHRRPLAALLAGSAAALHGHAASYIRDG
jgi:hypothetical protein